MVIPDLWGLRDQQYLTQAGTIRHTGPAALAIRQETQLLNSNHERVRPPRELAWALAMYLYSLRAPARPAGVPSLLARGESLFNEHCVECLHDGSLATLEDLFSTERLAPTYRGVHGVRAVPGHLWGTDWSAPDRTAMLAWLRAR